MIKKPRRSLLQETFKEGFFRGAIIQVLKGVLASQKIHSDFSLAVTFFMESISALKPGTPGEKQSAHHWIQESVSDAIYNGASCLSGSVRRGLSELGLVLNQYSAIAGDTSPPPPRSAPHPGHPPNNGLLRTLISRGELAD